MPSLTPARGDQFNKIEPLIKPIPLGHAFAGLGPIPYPGPMGPERTTFTPRTMSLTATDVRDPKEPQGPFNIPLYTR